MLNWLGVAIGGCGEEAARLAAQMVVARRSAPQASLIGQGARSDPASAALVNCIASSVLAFDDAHLPSVAHPSGPAASALFALAQTERVSGREFVNALALGIELQCRIGNMLVLPPGPIDPCFYINGISGPVGVAAAAARMLGLDAVRIGWAMGIAATQASGFRAVHGTMTSHLRPGHAARSGVEAALLARQGFDCISNALEADCGLVDVFATGSDPEIALAGLGERHEMLENRYKPYPCGIVIHPVIDACRELRAQIPMGGAIAGVRLAVNPLVLAMTGKRAPASMLEAHVSVFHWAAVSLLVDAPVLAANEAAALADPAIAALQSRIEAVPVPDMAKSEARVELTLDDGTVLAAHVTSARGSRERPLNDAELLAKFHDLAKRRLQRETAENLAALCADLGVLDDVGATIGALLP